MNDDPAPQTLRGEDLLRAAAGAGYVVNERLLETLRSQGLVPRPTRMANNGLRPVWSYPAGADGQLVAVMRYRARIKDPATLRALLWLDGYPVQTSDARGALVAVLAETSRELEAALSTEAERLGDDSSGARDRALESLAGQLAGRRGPHALPRRVRVKAAERADAVARLLRTFAFGEQQHVSEDTALVAERVLGISPGRRDKVAGVGPWLTGPAADMFEVGATVTSVPSMAQAVAEADDGELEQARVLAAALTEGLAATARLLAAATGQPNRAGFEGLAALDQDPFIRVLLAGTAVSMVRRGLGGDLARVAAAASPFASVQGDLDRILDMPASTVEQNLRRAAPDVRAIAGRLIDAALDGRLGSIQPPAADGRPQRG
nr:hypothetical protein KPHV_87630 [Kitasatospora purpeofusca]